jgi:formylglycine-generating enzyme required for sulfatase activity
MPAQESVRKQTTWGGAAGILLLAFALVYRFFPGLIHVTPQQHSSAGIPRPSLPLLVGVPRAVEFVGPPEEEIGPPRELAGLPPVPVPVEPVEPEKPATPSITSLLAKADKAAADGHLTDTGEDSALAIYKQVLAEDKNNRKAKAGMAAVTTALLDQARVALDRGDAEEAESVLGTLEGVPHSKDQFAALQERFKVVKQVAPLLAQAADLLKQGHMLEPLEGSALQAYRKVREIDPDNALASQGLEQIQRTLLDQTLAAVAQNDFPGADKLLAEAAEILPGSQGMLDTRTRVESLRRQQAESVMGQAHSALDSGNADLAEQLARRALSISADLAGIDEFNEKLRNARLYASLKPGEVVADPFLDRSGTGPALLVIPTGSFQMGSPETEDGHRSTEEPQREVTISVGFALGRSEVTVGQFREFVRAANYQTLAEREGSSSIYDENAGRMSDARASWQDDYRGKRAGDDLPVVHVAFDDTAAYLDWLSARTGKRFRLPSEAEFEYALRAGRTTRFSWGDGDPPHVVANVTGAGDRSPTHRTWSRAFARYNDGYWGPAPVQTFPPNPLGLYDMDGNVSEWMADCWHENYIRAPRDSRAWVNPGCERHVVRGGSWGSDPDQVRSAFRVSALAETRSARVGFRVARDL